MPGRTGLTERVAVPVLLLAFALPGAMLYLAHSAAQRLERATPSLNYRQEALLLNADVQVKMWKAAGALHRFKADRDAAAAAEVSDDIAAARSDVARMPALPGGQGAGRAFAGLAAAVEGCAAQLERERVAAADGSTPTGSAATDGDWQAVRAVDAAAAQVDAVQRDLMEQRRRAALAYARTWGRWTDASLGLGVLLIVLCVLALMREIRKRRREKMALARSHGLELAEAEHLATLGEIAAGLAHEIRNPLGGISAALEIIAPGIEAVEDRKAVAEMQQQVARILRVIEEMLHYARPQPLQLAPGDLNHTIEDAAQFLRRQAHAHAIEVTFEAGELPPVVHDPEQIHRVVVNLGINAIHAIPGAGRVVIATWFDPKHGMAGFDVRDNGTGIDPGSLSKIFRPFYSTKGKRGTGLGLSLCRRIAELHGGAISVRSTPGEGSVFTVALRTEARAQPARAAERGAAG